MDVLDVWKEYYRLKIKVYLLRWLILDYIQDRELRI